MSLFQDITRFVPFSRVAKVEDLEGAAHFCFDIFLCKKDTTLDRSEGFAGCYIFYSRNVRRNKDAIYFLLIP
ncbi:MAG TPA: hypothetical protein PKY86_03975 [Niabella sp.]|nr:hypothetical protein [Niabella sp.]HQW13764.1 hypothetical protein [Niabella sp.]HQX19159.1 hypothetical protein [Niabella sp.]HRB34310.1 hypothetical protein [Niabella sp.]HRB41464.1 hypothetical protein [Niabella sp.]